MASQGDGKRGKFLGPHSRAWSFIRCGRGRPILVDFVREKCSVSRRFLFRIMRSWLEKRKKHLGKYFQNQKPWTSVVREMFMGVE